MLALFWPTAALAQTPLAAQEKQATLGFPNQTLRIMPSAASGTLAYVLRGKITETAPFPMDVLFWKTGPTPKIVAHLSIEAQDPFPFAASFSPNGRLLLITTTSPTSFLNEYQFVILNLHTHKYKQGPHLRYFPKTVWSPDSRHIAYYEGGDQSGEFSMGTAPLQLFDYDVATEKQRLVAESDQVSDLAWTSQQTMLYAFKPKQPGETVYAYTFKHPAIYETMVSPFRSDKLIENGFNPSPSPNGKLIAFLGWRKADPEQQYGLYLFHRDTKKATLIQSLPLGQYEALSWTSDSTRLIVMRVKYKSTHPPFYSSSDTKDYPGYGAAQISIVDPVSLKMRALASLTATDEVTPQHMEAMFQFKEATQNKTIAVSVAEHGKKHNHYKLFSVNLKTGSMVLLFEGQDISSDVSSEIAWQETSAVEAP